MKIGKHNYEAFFLDYHEGNLSPDQVAELMLFLEQHPELKEELDAFEHVSLDDEPVSYTGKDELKRSAIERLFSAYADGILSPAEELELAELLASHPELKTELELFTKTRLAPEQVHFEHKDSLRKEGIEELFSQYADGTLSRDERAKAIALAQGHPALEKELALYLKTRLSPDLSVVMEGKHRLRRRERTTLVISLYRYAAAAAIALAVTLYFLVRPEEPGTGRSFTHQRKPGYIIRKDGGAPVQENTGLASAPEMEQKNTLPGRKNATLPVKQEDKTVELVQQVKNEQPAPDSLKQRELIASGFTPVDQSFFSDLAEPEPQQPDYLSLGELVAQNVKGRLLKEELAEDPNEDAKRLSWFNFGQLAVKGIRKLTGRDLKLQKEYSPEGDVVAYQVVAGEKTYSIPAPK